MTGGKISPKKPSGLGFGSSSPRFTKQKGDKVPGPGTYNLKKLEKGPSYSFGTPKRSPDDRRVDQHLKKNAGIGKLYSATIYTI